MQWWLLGAFIKNITWKDKNISEHSQCATSLPSTPEACRLLKQGLGSIRMWWIGVLCVLRCHYSCGSATGTRWCWRRGKWRWLLRRKGQRWGRRLNGVRCAEQRGSLGQTAGDWRWGDEEEEEGGPILHLHHAAIFWKEWRDCSSRLLFCRMVLCAVSEEQSPEEIPLRRETFHSSAHNLKLPIYDITALVEMRVVCRFISMFHRWQYMWSGMWVIYRGISFDWRQS